MKKIITAMNSQKLNRELKKEKNIEVVCNNIQYKEAIIDILELNQKKNIEIEILIIDENLPGEIGLEDLILNIKKINKNIKIIIKLEKENIELKNKIKKLKLKNIYLKNNIELNNLIEEIKIEKNKEINCKEKIVEETENIEINNYSIFRENINYKNNKNNKNEKIEIEKIVQKKSIIIISDNEEIKEKFIYYFQEINKNKKILIINFNIINNKNKYIKLNDYVDLVFWRNNIYKNNFDYNLELNKLLKKYNFIFLDFEINNFLITENKFLNNKNIIIILENNYEKIKLNYKKINKMKSIKNIKIIINKENKNKINKKIIKIIFKKIKIIGEINFEKTNKIKNNYKKIIKKINEDINKNYK